jgi:hypothetical protein
VPGLRSCRRKSPDQPSTRRSQLRRPSDPKPEGIFRSLAAQHAARKPYDRNRDATGNEPPTPRRHGQNERAIALNRKNALFAGSDHGGEHWAVIASLIETCKLNDLDPQHYLTHVITKIVNDHPNSQIDDLLPWTYLAAPALSDLA